MIRVYQHCNKCRKGMAHKLVANKLICNCGYEVTVPEREPDKRIKLKIIS